MQRHAAADLMNWYEKDLCLHAQVTTERIIQAFATVPRENFLGPGPWYLKSPSLEAQYQLTMSADISELYHNVLVAIRLDQGLNNGLPAIHAIMLDAVCPQPGEHVAHIGCGTGYYSAILAELVGPAGKVTAIELDADLAAQARKNLADYAGVEVHCVNGANFDFGDVDLIYVNAGVTHLPLLWLKRIRLGGRLLSPLTLSGQSGRLLKVIHLQQGLYAKLQRTVYFFDFTGLREVAEEEAMRRTVEQNGWNFQGWLRFDTEKCDETCWLKTQNYWLSRADEASERSLQNQPMTN